MMVQEYSGDVTPLNSGGPKAYTGQIIPANQEPGLSPLATAPPQPVQQPKPDPAAQRHEKMQQWTKQQIGGSLEDWIAKDPGAKAFVSGAFPGGLEAGPAFRAAYKAMPQGVQQGLQKMGNYLKSVADPGGKVSAFLQAGEGARAVAQKFVIHDQASLARDVKWKAGFNAFIEQNPSYKNYDEAIYHYGENSLKELPEGAKYYYDTFMKPIRDRNDKLFTEAKGLGVHVEENVDPKTYMFRQTMEKGEQPNWFTRMQETVDPTGALSSAPQPKGISMSAAQLKERTAGATKSSFTGEKGGYTIDTDTNQGLVWKDGQVVAQGKVTRMPGGAGKPYDAIITKNNEEFRLSRGTTEEIEQHTPVRYYKSAVSSLIETNRALNDVVANAKFVDTLKKSPEFTQLARVHAQAPEGWHPVSIPGYHGLDDYSFNPRLAAVLKDWTNTAHGDTIMLLQGVNRITQGSIFLNPLAHILNVKMHAMVEAGLFGGTERLLKGGLRAITPGEQTTTRRALTAVITKNEDYLRFLKQSTGMKGANMYVRDFGNQMLKSMGKDPTKLDPVAKAMGYASGAKLLAGAYKASNTTLWSTGDYIMMRAFLEREAEATTATGRYTEAGMQVPGNVAARATTGGVTKTVEQHIPNYQIPSSVLGTRSLSQILKFPGVMGFSRYEYNRLSSYGSMLRNTADSQLAPEALDQLAAVAFHYAVTYPLINLAIQHVTGNPHASFRPFGPFVYPAAVDSYKKGEKTTAQVAQTVARPSAAVQVASDLYRNRDWRDKPIYGAEAKKGDFTKYIMNQNFLTQAGERIANPPKGSNWKVAAKEFLEDQAGIKDPTPEQYAITRKYAVKALKERKKNETSGH